MKVSVVEAALVLGKKTPDNSTTGTREAKHTAFFLGIRLSRNENLVLSPKQDVVAETKKR